MKKTLLFAAFAAAALVSCSKDQVVDVKKNEIKFSVVADNATKAADVFCNGNYMDKFYVTGKTIPVSAQGGIYQLFMDNDLVTVAEDGTCTPSITRYWPTDGANMYVVAHNLEDNPIDPTNVLPGSVLTQPFTQEDDVEDHVDFIYAVNTDAENGEAISLNFRHALSMIEFQAKNTNANMHVNINHIALINTIDYGVFVYPDGSTTENYEAHSHDGTAPTVGKGYWMIPDPQETGEPLDLVTYIIQGDVTGVDVPGDGEIANLTVTSHDEKNPAEFNKTMLVVPHTAKATDIGMGNYAETNAMLAVWCTITNVVDADAGVQDVDKVLYNGWACVPLGDYEWKPGYKYIYTFVFGGNGGYNGGNDPDGPVPGDDPVLTGLSYEVSVDDFAAGNTTEVEMEAE